MSDWVNAEPGKSGSELYPGYSAATAAPKPKADADEADDKPVKQDKATKKK
jgi:hypothetical protein